jgi:hypothetical protein
MKTSSLVLSALAGVLGLALPAFARAAERVGIYDSRVDVTDALVRDLGLTTKQQKVAQEIAAKPPLPLAEARRLAAAGKL